MSSRNGLTIAGLAVAGAAGYYLYSAGGDPKVAEKQFEGRFNSSLSAHSITLSLA